MSAKRVCRTCIYWCRLQVGFGFGVCAAIKPHTPDAESVTGRRVVSSDDDAPDKAELVTHHDASCTLHMTRGEARGKNEAKATAKGWDGPRAGRNATDCPF